MNIETNVPIPESKIGSAISPTAIMRKMNIGDSVVVPFAVRSTWFSCATAANIKVTTRKIDNQTIRLWKIA